MMNREYYINLRDKYLPDDLKLIVVAESPPASGKYFYYPEGWVSEPLFRAMMHDVIKVYPKDKQEGLRAFRDAGMCLVDAVYQPVDKGFTKIQRDQIILRDYPLLKEDLMHIMQDKAVPLMLIKRNVCELLEPLLLRDNFTVLNKGQIIPFPSSGWQKRFRGIVGYLLQDWTGRPTL